MKYILKTLIDFLFYLLGLGILLAIGVFFISLFNLDFKWLLLLGSSTEATTPITVSVTILNYSISIIFFFGVGYLREAVKAFMEKKIFQLKTVSYFKRSGIYLSICATLGFISRSLAIIYLRIDNNKTDYGLGYSSLLIFMLICGLCFILISQILKESVAIKEENDLTI
ncbi:DUF2975 domain-containing protein [Mesonia maritima]|uniref:DUF2975 domain-containing protein n=1 Tax=Mesonia maritima TaxID=1793873 RepID=A0ABU1K2U7_9FLAO|nr:DUF2975 domain-containing protein [Mesonia maritima]MDR6299575.1 hypothetical protein [Mesonia maritima]